MTLRQGFQIARWSVLLLILGFLGPFAAGPATAQSLDDLRASGAVGERYDGYAEVRDPGASGAKSRVQGVNQKRKKIYDERAAAQGTTADKVGALYADQIMRKAPSGTWFLQENGKWRQ